MAFEHSTTLRVRQYDCDAHGHLNSANYLRYVEDAATEAVVTEAVVTDAVATEAAAGLDRNSQLPADGKWRASQLFIDYLRPLRYGEIARIGARLIDVQRDRALWAYEFREDTSGDLCADVQIAYVLSDRASGKRLPFPPEMVDSLQPRKSSDQAHRGIEFPAVPPQPSGALQGPWQIQWRDVDEDSCLKNAAYLDYFSEFITRASAGLGWHFKRYLEAGVLWFIKKQWLEIQTPAVLGDDLRVTTWLSELRRVRAMRHYAFHREDTGELLCQGHTLWVSIDPQSGRPTRMPRAFLQDFGPQMATVGVQLASVAGPGTRGIAICLFLRTVV
jgi:acyl-CoA thioester hydrolase